MLIDAALSAGAFYINSNTTRIDKDDEGYWRIYATKDNGHIEHIRTEMVVDATGRSSYFARKQNVRRISYDRLIGIIGILSSECQDTDSMTLIESVPDGWWYSARIPGSLRIAIFFTHSDLTIVRYARTALGWKKLLQDTVHIRDSIEINHYNLVVEPYAVMANSSRLQQVTGRNWIAVGDAAAAYDPLSSLGILLALGTGIGAAQSIMLHFDGKISSLAKYEEKINQTFHNYLKKRIAYYNIEQRWPDSTFWKQSKNIPVSVFSG
jgi:flavin-dependent dehydrogenase